MILDDEREKITEHFLGHIEVGDDAILHGADGDHPIGRPAEHALRFQADALDLLRLTVNGDHGGFIEHDTLAFDVDESICRAEVNTDRIRGKERSRLEEGPAHPVVRSVVTRPAAERSNRD